MTDKTKQLIAQFEKELEELPDEEQEAYVTSYLEDLRWQKQSGEEGSTVTHPSLAILQKSELEGLPADYSERLDHYLYGTGEE